MSIGTDLFLYLRVEHRYDFDKDGSLKQEDIRMLLLYVPFKREDALVSTLSQMTPTSPKK